MLQCIKAGGQDMMTTTIPIPEMMQFLTGPEGDVMGMRDPEPVLTDAEEEELAELWAGDRGNQGA
jgi:hypothetical protein